MIVFYRNNSLSKAVLIFSALWLPVACDKSDPKEHLQRGVEYFKQGNYEKAKLELKTSSQSDKNTAETYYYLALLDEKNHQYKAMRENLTKAIELEPKNIEARLKLGKLLLPFNEPDAALAQAETILKDNSQNLDAQALKASVFIRQKKFDEALGIIDGILQKDPKFIEALSLKVLIFNERQQTEKALALLDTAIAIDPKNVDLNFFKIQLHAKAKDMTAVVADYLHLTDLFPENQDYKITLARLYAQVGKKQEAEDLLRSLITAKPTEIKLKVLLLDFLMDSAPNKVAEQLSQFTKAHFDEPRKLLEMANWTITRKQFEEAEKMLTRVVDIEKDSPVGLSAKTLMAKIAFEHQDYAETERLIAQVLEDNSNYNDAKILQSRVFLVKKQYDKAVDLLHKVLLSQPELEEGLLLSGQAFLAMGDPTKANQYFEDALKVNPANSQALDYLYNRALAENKIKVAKDMVAAAVKIQPNNLAFLEKLANINLLDADLKAAKDAVQQITNLQSPLSEDLATFLRAQILQAEGECSQAVGLYKALLVKFPGNKDTLDNMARCYVKMNKRSEMIAELNTLRSASPNNLAINLLLADLLLGEKKWAEGVELLTQVVKNNPKVPQVYVALAKFKQAQNDKNAALAVYQEGLKQNPDDIRLSLSLASLYQEQNKNDLAVSVYEGLLAKNPGFELVINNLAVVLIERYGDAEKLQKAEHLVERFKNSDQPYFKDTYAWALVKSGKASEGAAVLQEVITSAPDIPVFRYHLGVAYANNNDNGNAIAQLQQALELSSKGGNLPEAKEAKALLEKLIAKTQGH